MTSVNDEAAPTVKLTLPAAVSARPAGPAAGSDLWVHPVMSATQIQAAAPGETM